MFIPPRRRANLTVRAFTLIVSVFLCVALLSSFFFIHSVRVTEENLDEQLRSMAAIAALQFNGDELDKIRGRQSMRTEFYRKAVEQLYKIRTKLPDIQYIYVMRKTDHPKRTEFIADADAYNREEPADFNGNGLIDPDENMSRPGDIYDVTDVPALQEDAFLRPTTDEDFTADQWGTYISGYAPIYDSAGQVVATLGIDMNARTYLERAQSQFRPAVFLLLILLALFVSSYVGVVIWRRRMEVMNMIDGERSALINLAMHQLGTPLAIFRWWVEILKEKGDMEKDEEHKEICDRLDEGVSRMTEVMSALHDVSTLESQLAIKEKNPIDLCGVISDVIGEFKERIEERAMDFSVSCSTEHKVLIPRKVLSGILRELLSNAIDYSPVKSAVRVTVTKATRKTLKLEIEDHGCGIPADEIHSVFERFTRASNAPRIKPTGNGAGLYIVKRIVESVGGRIGLKSELQKGTTVTVILPSAS